MTGLDDRVVTLLGTPNPLADVAGVLGSPTRLAVLAALVRSPEALHIQELARRVGVDASPVRTHLEVLCRAGLAREVKEGTGRERRFKASVTDVRMTLVDANRPPDVQGPPTRKDVRVQAKLADLGKKMAKLEREAAELRKEL